MHIVVAGNAHSGLSRTEHGGSVKEADPAEDLLKDLTEIAEGRGHKPVRHQSKAAPADALVEVAEHVDADLIVVGIRG